MIKPKNRLVPKLIAIVGCLLLAGSCSSRPGGTLDDPLIAQKSMLDKDRFIEQSKSRATQDVPFGPTVDSSKDNSIRDSYRKQINREESLDYMMKSKDEAPAFPIDLNVENIDIRTLAKMLSRVTGMNLLVSDEATGLVTAQLNDVPWTNALDSVLQIKKLAKHVDTTSNIIRIHDQATVMALEDFDKKRRQTQQEALQLAKASEPMYTEIFKLFYTKPDEVKKMLEGVLGLGKEGAAVSEALRNTQPEITIDGRMNMIIVKARKSDMELISKVINEVDGRTKQVFIEAFIVEVEDDFEHQLGTRLGLEGDDTFVGYDGKRVNVRTAGLAGIVTDDPSLGNTTDTVSNLPIEGAFGGIGFLAGLGSSADLKLELTAMEAEGLTKVISNPRIFTLDNQEAIIFQGDEVPYETVSQEGTKIEFKEAGLRLAVTPTIVGDGNMMLTIAVNKDTVDTSVSNPPITKSEIRTSLVTKDQSTVVIGGIYSEDKATSKDKVPGLADIPVLGELFQRNAKQDNRRELMIFISPRIL